MDKGFLDVFEQTEGRIIVTTFASNVHRIQQVIQASVKTKRKLVVVGKSMVRVITIATKLGYLDAPKDLFIEIDEVGKYRDEQVSDFNDRQSR